MILHGKIVLENGAELPFELYPDDAAVQCYNRDVSEKEIIDL